MPVNQLSDRVIASLASNSTTSVTVHFFGATILSWKTNGEERLFLSEKAILNGSKAIRIPLVFPIFGPDLKKALPQHGFARLSNWKLLQIMEPSTEECQLIFQLTPTQVESKFTSVWPYAFELTYTIILRSTSLVNQISIMNKDPTPWNFHWLFHTYFNVPSIQQLSIPLLANQPYFDTLTQSPISLPPSPSKSSTLTITQETDRIYSHLPSSMCTLHPMQLHVYSTFPDYVLWHPWQKSIPDLHSSETMVCLEAGQVQRMVSLHPNQRYMGVQVLTL